MLEYSWAVHVRYRSDYDNNNNNSNNNKNKSVLFVSLVASEPLFTSIPRLRIAQLRLPGLRIGSS